MKSIKASRPSRPSGDCARLVVFALAVLVTPAAARPGVAARPGGGHSYSTPHVEPHYESPAPHYEPPAPHYEPSVHPETGEPPAETAPAGETAPADDPASAGEHAPTPHVVPATPSAADEPGAAGDAGAPTSDPSAAISAPDSNPSTPGSPYVSELPLFARMLHWLSDHARWLVLGLLVLAFAAVLAVRRRRKRAG